MSVDGEVVWNYDDSGRLDSVVSPEATVSYDRDEFGRALGETVTLATGESSAVNYSLDGFGRAEGREVVLPDGGRLGESFTRDSLGEIAEVEVTADGGVRYFCGKRKVVGRGRRSIPAVGGVGADWIGHRLGRTTLPSACWFVGP